MSTDLAVDGETGKYTGGGNGSQFLRALPWGTIFQMRDPQQGASPKKQMIYIKANSTAPNLVAAAPDEGSLARIIYYPEGHDLAGEFGLWVTQRKITDLTPVFPLLTPDGHGGYVDSTGKVTHILGILNELQREFATDARNYGGAR